MVVTSPYSLLQEELRDDPWKMLVACILLNRTSHKQVRPVIWSLFDAYPDAAAMAGADPSAIAHMLKPLGLQNRRARTLMRFSVDYCRMGTIDIESLHGVGKYASDSYVMFVLGDVEACEPTDKKLAMYSEWWHADRHTH